MISSMVVMRLSYLMKNMNTRELDETYASFHGYEVK